ncbi:transposase [Cereibacter sphaeroides]|uniref:transposase n=1 Tax=Cereibacter sphaeroides TaxID=1063 RepID=UPI001F488B83|nr:transposase [Cereibacter sphaeroides]MCE6949500.1 transposase [Cereibacter sphaeroides]
MADQNGEEDDGVQDAIHWYTLALRLRDDHQAPWSESWCRDRLACVRWPTGVHCPRCGSDNVLDMPARSVWKCRACTHQFSVTAGTHLHGSRIGLRHWFHATDNTIRYRRAGGRDFHIPVVTLATTLGIHNAAARRMKKIILEDLAPEGPGLLRAGVCMKTVMLPPDIVPRSRAHLWWLTSQW